jgi:hypothetical protein
MKCEPLRSLPCVCQAGPCFAEHFLFILIHIHWIRASGLLGGHSGVEESDNAKQLPVVARVDMGAVPWTLGWGQSRLGAASGGRLLDHSYRLWHTQRL